MITEINTKTETRSETSNADSVMGWAVMGCLVAGAVGVIKALGMERGSDVMLCLLGSIAAFGTVFYVHLRKH